MNRGALGGAGLVILLAACGGGAAIAPETKAPASAAPDAADAAPTTIASAQAQIARSRAELQERGDLPADTGLPKAQSAPGRAPSVPTSEDRPAVKIEDGRCAPSCRALASMRSAVRALCRLTGTSDDRCIDAQHTLTESERRVFPCPCP
jgi:hypothetical protein